MDKRPESKNGGNTLDTQDALACPSSVSVTHVRIRLHRWREVPATPENDYQAVIIRERDRILYQARGVVIPIMEDEAQQVERNPFMYYFSTALKLHNRIERAKLTG
jgi:hypothetical protein